MFIMALFQPYPRKYVNTIFPPCSISHLVDVAYLKVEQALELHHRLQLVSVNTSHHCAYVNQKQKKKI
jgi:hypothetical protein